MLSDLDADGKPIMIAYISEIISVKNYKVLSN